MNELYFVVALAPILLVGLVMMRRVGRDRAVRHWGLAWLCLWSAGLAVALTTPTQPLRTLSALFEGLFAAFMLTGSLAFLGRPSPAWIPALGLLLGAGTGGLRLAGWSEAALALSRTEALLLVAPAPLLWRSAPERLAPERMLAMWLAALGVVHLLEWPLVGAQATGIGLLALWGGLGLGCGLTQLFCLLEARRRSEERLHRALESEQRTLRTVIDDIPAALLLVDPGGRIRLHNQRAAEFAGLAPGTSLIGRDIEDYADQAAVMVAESEREGLLAALREMGWMPDARDEFEIRQGGPSERWLAVSVREVEGAGGDRLGRLWIAQDRTEAKRLASRLELAGRMEALGKAIGGIAHDFNNQLTSILGHAELILARGEIDDNVRESARAIENAATHSAEITSGLLDFARERTGPLRPVDVAKELASLRCPPGVQLETYVAPELPALLADPPQVRRVLVNLVANACYAAGEGGRVRLEAEPGPHGTVCLRVRDDGPGMDAETRARMFDPFFTTRPGAGTGLGLAIVHGIASAHGAEIEVSSAPGSGTCVSLLWPGTDERPIPGSGSFDRDLSEVTRNRVVLLVEDEPGVRAFARRALNESGYRVIEAEDGETALEIARRSEVPPHVAVLDVDLPGHSGIETLRGLRRRWGGLPALLVSGHASSASAKDCPADVKLLPKPFGPQQLTSAVSEALGE